MTHVSNLFIAVWNIPASHSQSLVLYIFGPLPKYGISLGL